MRTMILGLAVALFPACGHGGKGGGSSDANPSDTQLSDPYHSLAVADATKLPECKPEAEGWLIYLKTEKQFQVCSGGAWGQIDIVGEIAAGASASQAQVNSTIQVGGGTTDVQSKSVKDTAGKVLGFSADTGDTLTVFISNGSVANVTVKLADGLQAGDVATACYTAKADCSGDCYFQLADASKSIVTDPATIIVPTTKKTGIVGTLQGKKTAGGCSNTPLEVHSQTYFYIGESRVFSLPFHVE